MESTFPLFFFLCCHLSSHAPLEEDQKAILLLLLLRCGKKKEATLFFPHLCIQEQKVWVFPNKKAKNIKKAFSKKVFVSRTLLCSGTVLTVLARLFFLQTSSIHWIGKGLSSPFHSSDFESFKREKKVVQHLFSPPAREKKPAVTSGFSFCIGTELSHNVFLPSPHPLFPPPAYCTR